ncbi:MAG: hypothetical protein ABSE80_14000 [Halobacteriota archaeon]|jgi:hypothetical protein
MTNIPATHDPRTDAQILADKDKNKDLERGTVRDANGVPRDMRQFPPAPVESYSQYLARVSGLTDFTPLTEAQWRKETGQKTTKEQILADLGITPRPIVEVKVPLDTPVLDGTEEGTWVAQELDIAEYIDLKPTVKQEAEARHIAAHPPVVNSVKLEIDPIEEV